MISFSTIHGKYRFLQILQKSKIAVELRIWVAELVEGIDANIWLRLQEEYNLQVAKQDKKLLQKINRIRECAAIFL